jgi:hypothetical protein
VNVLHLWALKHLSFSYLAKLLIVSVDSLVIPEKMTHPIDYLQAALLTFPIRRGSGLLSLLFSLLWKHEVKTDTDANRTQTPFQITSFIWLPVYVESWLSAMCKCRGTDVICDVLRNRQSHLSTQHSLSEAGNIIKLSGIFPRYPAQSLNHKKRRKEKEPVSLCLFLWKHYLRIQELWESGKKM